MSDPKRIWLQQPEDSDPMYAPYEGDRTWCENPIEAEDTEYVRADLYESLQTQLDAVRGLPEQWLCVETRTMMESAIFATCADELEAKLKEAGDE